MEKEDRKEFGIYQDVDTLPAAVNDTDVSSKDSDLGGKVTPARSADDFYDPADDDSDDHIIRTGADVSNYLMSLRDDGDPSLTVRGVVIGTIMTVFSSAVNQIYNVGGVHLSISVRELTRSSNRQEQVSRPASWS